MFHPHESTPPDSTEARLPHNVAVETLGKRVTPLLEKGVTLPAQIVQVFSTAMHNQSQVEVHVLFGGGDTIDTNASLGKFVLTNLPPAPRGVPQIEVTISVDAQQSLTVTAKDRGTGRTEQLGQAVNLFGLAVPPYDESKRPHVTVNSEAPFAMSDFSDIFEEFFAGVKKPRPATAAPVNLDLNLNLTFREALLGTLKTVEVNRVNVCSTCGGSGGEAGTQIITCAQCKGAGQVQVTQTTFLGKMVTVQPCTRCHGKGSIVVKPCPRCHGSGQLTEPRQMQVKVPPRVTTGTVIRLASEGDIGADGKTRTDVMLHVRVMSDPQFTLVGNDIQYTLKLSKAQAAQGGTFTIPTIDGTPTEITVPPKTTDGQVITLTGRGAPIGKDGSTERGALHIMIKVAAGLFGLF